MHVQCMLLHRNFLKLREFPTFPISKVKINLTIEFLGIINPLGVVVRIWLSQLIRPLAMWPA